METKIGILLEKYFEGDTSVQEERELQRYFSSGEVDAEHLQYAPMFQFFETEKSKASPVVKEQSKRNRILWLSMTACAACLAIVFLVTNIKSDNLNESLVYVDGRKISDPQIINNYIVESIADIQHVDQNVMESQIEVLDFFTE